MAFYHFYYTPQFVAINDSKLGPLAFILTLLVLVNSIFSILVYKGYLEYETPRGVLQFDLTHQHSLSLQNTTYCEKELCAIRDEKEVLVETGPDSVMITTYVEEYEEERICDYQPKNRAESNPECPEVWKKVGFTKYYIADLEDFELEVDHSMKAHRFYEATHFSPEYAKGVKDMPGVLLGNHSVIKKLKEGETDKFYIKELLKASGLHDGLSEEQRQQGVHLQVDLHYGNARCDGSMYCWFGTIPAEYRYRVYEVPHANFKVVDIEPRSSITHRWVKVRRGIHIQGVQGGRIGKVSMGVLMTQLATAVGMLGLVNILVDNLMCYVLPRKAVYTDWKYVVRTVDEVKLPPKPEIPDKKDN